MLTCLVPLKAMAQLERRGGYIPLTHLFPRRTTTPSAPARANVAGGTEAPKDDATALSKWFQSKPYQEALTETG